MKRRLEHLPNQRGGSTDDTTPEVEVVDFDNAESLFQALLPVGSSWDGDRNEPPRWIYRGQANAQWDLTPSAFRPNVLRDFLSDAGLLTEGAIPGAASSRNAEIAAVMAFVSQCRNASIPVPEDSQILRALERKILEGDNELFNSEGNYEFPPMPLLSLFALAQHHGVPTRLLDWTTSPFTATYFAVQGAAATNHSGRIAVWALLLSEVLPWSAILYPGIRLAEAPHDANAFLRAQQGLFTVVQSARPGHGIPEAESIHTEEAISYAWWYAPGMGHPPSRPWVKKYTLPVEEAGRALRLLDRMNVSAATLFPGPGGVVRALRERRLWR